MAELAHLTAKTMSLCEFGPHWLLRLQARATQRPTRPRVPFYLGSQPIGTVEPGYLTAVAADLGPKVLQRLWLADGERWCVMGDGTTSLSLIAQTLRAVDGGSVGRHWRDEQLDVLGPDGAHVAKVERGVVRPLGIATRAVHLVGFSTDRRVWVQQRSRDKANDPGLWDTVMGGMVAAGETVESTLARETWEEAGMVLDTLVDLRRGGTVSMQKPSSSDDDSGYVNERVDWFECTIPDDVNPVNQDGEVARFDLMGTAELRASLERDEFTTEAALILVQCLSF